MLIPPVCYNCGTSLLEKEEIFLQGIREGKSNVECFIPFQIKWRTNEKRVYTEMCLGCKRMFIGYMNVCAYLQVVEQIENLEP
jgi:hypothetical protein